VGWLQNHWKTIATIAVATVAFVAVTALTGGLGAAPMAALFVGGFASGVAGYATDGLLNKTALTVKGALLQGGTAAVLTVATAGIGRLLAPAVSKAVTPVVSRLVPETAEPLVTRTVVNTGVGASLGAATKVADNALDRRPLGEGVKNAALLSGATGAAIEPLQGVVARARVAPPSGGLGEEPLTHLTSPEGKAGIEGSGQLVGKKGIFAVPAPVADESTLAKVVRTGLTPDKTTDSVPVPGAATGLFEQPTPIGPYSLLKRLGGVRFAPPGSIDVTTGAFTPSGALVGPAALIYGPDFLAYGALVGIGHVLAADPGDAPPPPPAQSPGMTAVLGKAVKSGP
jgi:hypothetical protein